jgi:hypothetical protein
MTIQIHTTPLIRHKTATSLCYIGITMKLCKRVDRNGASKPFDVDIMRYGQGSNKY